MTDGPASTRARVVGVCGAGTMGAGIAQVCLARGHEVVLYDVDEAAVSRGRQRIEEGLARLVARGRLESEARDGMLAALRESYALDDLAAGADLVIEAALEDLGLKQTIFRALDAAARPDVLLATNTSSLSVTGIAESTARPERVVGLHFFNPAPVMPLVEVVSGERTDAEVAERAYRFAEELGKEPVACRDAPGFIVNRVNRPFTLEALRMVEAGEAGFEEIDRAVESAGYPMGPFRLMDLVGVDVNYAVARALFEAFDGAVRFTPSPIQEAKVAAGELGRKTGSGFYRYAADGSPLGRAGADFAGRSSLAPPDVVRRIEVAIINEAYHAAGDGVADPVDVDRAMKLGANHPMGPFERARELGLKQVIDALRALERSYGERFRVAPALWQIATV